MAGIALLAGAMPAFVYAAADMSVRFRHVSRDDGLSQAYVYAIAQDQQGFLWFGTQEGLNRYDGYELRVFGHDPADDGSIPEDTIYALLVTRDGVLWVGTDGGGLAHYDSDAERFYTFRSVAESDESLSSNRIRVLYEDAAGTLWIGTDGGGLNSLDRSTGEFVHWLPDDRDERSDGAEAIWSLAEDSRGGLWVGTESGLFYVDPARSGLSRLPADAPGDPLASWHARRLLVDDRDRLWIGTENRGLLRRDPVDGSVTRFAHSPDDTSTISAQRITSLFQDDSSSIWVGTVAGLNRYDDAAGSFYRYNHDPGDRYSLANDTVMAIADDASGILWFGTYDGLSYWDTLTAAMHRYVHDPDSQSGLSADSVTSFTEDSAGTIWIGTHGGGINLLRREYTGFEYLRRQAGADNGLSSDRVMALARGPDDRIWAGTREAGIDVLDENGVVVKRFRHDPADPNSLSADQVSFILRDSRATLWVATFGGGLNRYDARNERFVRIRADRSNPYSLASDQLLTLFEDRERNLWIGSYGAGVTRLNLATGHFSRYAYDEADSNSLSGDNIFAFVEDNAGDLWIGTQGRGLNRWRASDRRDGKVVFEHVTERHGLPSMTIYGAVVDEDGFLWLGTGNGLSRLDPETLAIENYDTSHGLQDPEFNLSAAFRASDGMLYFGGGRGFNSFHPQEIRGNDFAPPVVLTGFRKLNSPVPLPSIRNRAGPIVLGYKDYVIEFEIAGLHFSAPEKNEYRYRLDGLDTEWVDAGTNRRITYTNLSPGRYTFNAMASNNYGVWSDPTALATLQVNPAPWASTWAYALYAMLLAASLYALLRAHTNRLRQAAIAEHAAHMENLNLRLTQEIDVREAKEIQLEREKEKAQAYFNVAEVVLVTLDSRGCIEKINSKGASILGFSADDLQGRAWFDFVAEDWREAVRTDLLAKFNDGPGRFRDYLEYPLEGVSGRQHLIAWNCNAMRGDDGSELLFCSGMDVTRVRSLEKQVRLREKMNAIGTLAGGIAHDFNNILQAIYGFTTLTLDELDPKDPKSQYLQQVVKGADRARNLVKRILTFSNQKEYDLKPIDLAPVVEEACALLRGSLPATVEITTTIDKGQGWVLADPTRIHQMIMNLGTNAGQAIGDDGGFIDVRLKAVEVAPEHISAGSRLEAGDYVMLRIADSGCGMDAATLDHIYDPFFTTKETSGSTGLGLTVVHGIVQSHAGMIDVQSAPGEGTTFVVYFPITDEVPERLPVSGRRDHFGSGRILVVDDEEWVITVTQKILETHGYEVSVCNSGETALKLIERRSDDFDLLITDETMPRMTGSQLMRNARAVSPDLPVIIISGKQAPAAVGEPNTRFLQKPFTAAEIAECVGLGLRAPNQKRDVETT